MGPPFVHLWMTIVSACYEVTDDQGMKAHLKQYWEETILKKTKEQIADIVQYVKLRKENKKQKAKAKGKAKAAAKPKKHKTTSAAPQGGIASQGAMEQGGRDEGEGDEEGLTEQKQDADLTIPSGGQERRRHHRGDPHGQMRSDAEARGSTEVGTRTGGTDIPRATRAEGEDVNEHEQQQQQCFFCGKTNAFVCRITSAAHQTLAGQAASSPPLLFM